MSRYCVGTPAQLELLRIALDQANGFRDAAGAPVRLMHRVMLDGVQVGEIASDEYCLRYGVQPTTSVPAPVLGDDGTAALELPEHELVEPHLGKTVRGLPVPRARDLVTDEAQLPARVKAELDRRRAVDELDAAMGLRAQKR